MILGNHVTVSCLVSAVSMDGALDIRWRINGRLVKPLANSRIQTTELNRDSYDPSLYTSNLVINGIKKIDTGIKIYTFVQVKSCHSCLYWQGYMRELWSSPYISSSKAFYVFPMFWCRVLTTSFFRLILFPLVCIWQNDLPLLEEDRLWWFFVAFTVCQILVLWPDKA